MADVLESLVAIANGKDALDCDGQIVQAFGHLFRGIETNVDLAYAIACWSARVRTTLAGTDLDVIGARSALLAADGTARAKLAVMGRAPTVGVLRGEIADAELLGVPAEKAASRPGPFRGRLEFERGNLSASSTGADWTDAIKALAPHSLERLLASARRILSAAGSARKAWASLVEANGPVDRSFLGGEFETCGAASSAQRLRAAADYLAVVL